MDIIKKNRLKFQENEESEVSHLSNEGDMYSLSGEDEPRSKKRWNLPVVSWAAFITIFVILVGIGIVYQFNKKSDFPIGLSDSTQKPTEDSNRLKSNAIIDTVIEKPYLPLSSLNPKLKQCINLYKERNVQRAFIQCEEFLNTPASNTEKSIALTILGVMFDEGNRTALAIERFNKALKYDPENVHAYYNMALAYQHSGDFANAKKTILKAREIAPDDPRIASMAGNLLNKMEDPTAAIKTYQEGMSENPNDAYLTYNLALSYYKQGDIASAMETFKRASLLNNNYITALSNGHLGTIYFNRNDMDAAEHHFREALVTKPNDARYLYNLGVVLLNKKKNEDALAAFSKALEAGSNDPQIYRYIAQSFEDLRMPSNAITSLKKALSIRPDDIESLFQLADLYYREGNLSDSEEIYRNIVLSTPGDSNTESALINLGIIMNKMERHSEAITSFEKVIHLNPKNDSAYYNLGIAYKNAEQPTKAIENWRKSASLNPTEVKSAESIGDYYFENGYYLEAVREYEDIVRNNNSYKIKLKLADSYFRLKNYPTSEKILLDILNHSTNGDDIKLAHRKLALVYSETNDVELKTKAKDEAYRSAHIDPEDMEGRLVLAKILIDSNSTMDREKAIDELTTIIRSDVSPKVASMAYNLLGLCYYKNGQFKKAIREFQNSIELDPSLTEAYENKRAARASYEDSLRGNRTNL
ncbi:MAG: tetratricopeptide repeat protein [Leptospiraceae bacterium]|nr:tetratricopeptide repeat protein [Leptospiraceae bacterium]MCP5495604.1 tetratricopeptide repeat protein [Leptospiraceae bacterium]